MKILQTTAFIIISQRCVTWCFDLRTSYPMPPMHAQQATLSNGIGLNYSENKIIYRGRTDISLFHWIHYFLCLHLPRTTLCDESDFCIMPLPFRFTGCPQRSTTIWMENIFVYFLSIRCDKCDVVIHNWRTNGTIGRIIGNCIRSHCSFLLSFLSLSPLQFLQLSSSAYDG